METKRCTKCGEVKPLDEYHKDKRRGDGRRSDCRTCVKARDAEHYQANRERKLEYRATHYAENRDRIRESDREYSARPEVKARRAEYHAARPHIRWECDYRTRARAYGFEPRVVRFTREALIEAHGDRCVHCGGPFESLDHYPHPISRGGVHSLTNCVPSCLNCQRYSWREDFTPTNTLKETTA